MKVLVRQRDLSDDYLRFAVQIGADGIDIHNAESLPGFAEQGYPHLEELRMLKARVEAAGLHIYRVTPAEPIRFLSGEPDGETQLETPREVGFNGGLQMDHLPHYDDDDGQRSATAFAVGYTKALLQALDG